MSFVLVKLWTGTVCHRLSQTGTDWHGWHGLAWTVWAGGRVGVLRRVSGGGMELEPIQNHS
ncbi:MAG: hypothetical protein JXM68_02460 [Sedimentisphaerales bacterium]|nr:hypothetical protein [Sedimentisphaerales bacterium]